MKTQKKLSREEMKNVTGGIPVGDWIITCSLNGVNHTQVTTCGNETCTTGTFVSATIGNGC